MSISFITFRSVTFAQRGEELLRKNGIFCILQRTPKWMEKQGCGYCLRLRQKDYEQAATLLRQHQVLFRKVYLRDDSGEIKEVPL